MTNEVLEVNGFNVNKILFWVIQMPRDLHNITWNSNMTLENDKIMYYISAIYNLDLIFFIIIITSLSFAQNTSLRA